ncbi:MAG: transporter [Herbaspirillum sp.]|jgi:multidrug efflux system outer membrane protein|nr:transporter [Herbaspirillum sp.]
MKRGRYRLLFAAAIALAGCASRTADYQRPAAALIATPAANGKFVGAGGPAFSPEPPPANWWRLYRDPVLDKLVAQALAANTDLRVASANIARSVAHFDVVDDARQPQTALLAAPSFGRRSAEEELRPGKPLDNHFTYGAGASVSYQVDMFGQVARAIESAQADVAAARAAYDTVRITVVAETTRAYLEACNTEREIGVAEHSIALQRESGTLVQKLQHAGRGISFDVSRADAQLDQVRASLPPLQAQRQLALYRLAVLTGRPPADMPALQGACVQAPGLEQAIPVGDGAELLRRRPDVRRAEEELKSAHARIGVATAELYPKITLGASFASVGLTESFLKADTFKFSLGPLISWQFPNRAKARASIRDAQAQSDAAYARFDGTVLAALRETESALTVYARDLDRRALLRSAQRNAGKAAQDAELLFQAGRHGYLPVLDANRSLLAVDQALAGVESKIAADQVQVFLALGGGWEETNAAPALAASHQ